jgi:hypothetical protein
MSTTNVTPLKFRVESAELSRVLKGENKNKPFIKMHILEDDLFADDRSEQNIVLFIPEANVEAWEEVIAKGVFPPVYGAYHFVEVPSYTAKHPKTGIMSKNAKDSIRIFVRYKGGQPVEDPRSRANRLLADWLEDGTAVLVGVSEG